MKILQFILVLIVAAGVAYGVSHRPAADEQSAAASAGYAYVKQHHEIRCSYASLYPYVIVDPNTKQLSGISYDIMNEIGKRTGFKVIWTEEVGWGAVSQGFETRRYDAFCTGVWPSGVRSPVMSFSQPLVYDVLTGWLRADDTRFDGHIDRLNNPAYTVTAIEGDTTMSVAQNVFPQAKIYAISQSQPVTDAYMAVVGRRADVLFTTVTNAMKFAADNPHSIKQADSKPVRVIPLTIGLPANDFYMKNLVDPVIAEIQDDGFIRSIVTKYLGADQNVAYFADKPYLQPVR